MGIARFVLLTPILVRYCKCLFSITNLQTEEPSMVEQYRKQQKIRVKQSIKKGLEPILVGKNAQVLSKKEKHILGEMAFEKRKADMKLYLAGVDMKPTSSRQKAFDKRQDFL